jgi:uncharacterized membrane protein
MQVVIKAFLTTFLVLLPIDVVWLFGMKGVYDKWLSGFERVLNLPAAFLVYIFIPLGLSYLVISKYFGQTPNLQILSEAFIYGICAYAVYDLTNLATLKGWSITMTIVDIIWGGILCTLTAFIALYLSNKITWPS